MNKSKIAVFYFITCTLLLILIAFILELGGRIWFNNLKLPSNEQWAMMEKYSLGINHVREPKGYFPPSNNYERLLFTRKGNEKAEKKIFLQGDSWFKLLDSLGGDQFVTDLQTRLGEEFLYINGGTSSYSPTPFTIQLRRLREMSKIHPNYVVTYIDQTDVGDEGCRYNPLTIRDGAGKPLFIASTKLGDPSAYNLSHWLAIHRYINNEPSKFLALLTSLFYHRHFIRTSEIGYPLDKCGFNEIMSYARNPKNALEHERAFRSSLDSYIDEVFADPRVEKLLILTHPHRGHLPASGESSYKGDVGDIVKSVVSKRKNVSYVNLGNSLEKIYGTKALDDIFKSNSEDPASHLLETHYSGAFAKAVADATFRAIDQKQE